MNSKFDSVYLMKLFINVVDFGSFSSAARRVGVTASKASKDIQYLESTLGSILLNRTTRSINLTDAGELYYKTAQDILELHCQLVDNLQNQKSTLSGELRVTAPELWGVNVLTPIILSFKKKYKDVTFFVDFCNELRDLHRDSIHVAFRSTELTNEPYLSKVITDNEYVLCASKEYVDINPIIESHTDLDNHQLIALANSMSKAHSIKFKNEGEIINYSYISELSFSSSFAIYLAVKAGSGIAVLPKYMVSKDIQEENLIEVLPDYHINRTTFYALYTKKRQESELLNCFINFVQEFIHKQYS